MATVRNANLLKAIPFITKTAFHKKDHTIKEKRNKLDRADDKPLKLSTQKYLEKKLVTRLKLTLLCSFLLYMPLFIWTY